MPLTALNPRFYGTSADEYITDSAWYGVSSSVSAVKWEFSPGHFQFIYNIFTRTFDTVWVPEELTSSPYNGLTTDASEYISAGGGNDFVRSAGGNDLIYAGSGDDTIYGGTGDDTVNGGTGDDTIYANQGSDRVNPGSGDDTVYAGSQYTEFGSASGRTLIVTDGGAYLDLEEVSGDLFIASYDQDILDRFHGGEPGLYHTEMTHAIVGNFFELKTGSGDDTIYGSYGYKQFHTGAGDDMIFLVNRATIAGEAAEQTVNAGDGDDIVDARGDARTQLEGTAGRDDTYFGIMDIKLEGGDDTYFGWNGSDGYESGYIRGGDGNDSLYGFGGDDYLSGGNGADLLDGGTGRDTFIFSLVRDSRPGAAQRDTIAGFDGAGSTTGDIIDVSGIDARWTGAGDTSDQAFTFGGRGIGRIWTENDSSGNTLVRAENNNVAGVDFEILIADGDEDASAYTAADFML